MAQVNKKKKLSKQQRVALDNKIVLSTSIALVATIFLMYLYRWQLAYPLGTRKVILVLMWAGVLGVAATLGMYFWKKNKKWLVGTAYSAAASFIFSLIAYNFLHFLGLNTGSAVNYTISYIILAVYLIASYVNYAIALKKSK